MILFWIGYTIMFFNEGFVIMRHVSPWFANKREQLHNKFGKVKMKRIHGFTDWTWIILIALGIYLDFENWSVYVTLMLAYWSAIAVMIYIPMLVRRLRGKPTSYVK